MFEPYIVEENVRYDANKLIRKYIDKLIENKKSVYIPRFNRKFILTKEEMNAIDTLFMIDTGRSLRDRIETGYDLKDPFTYEKLDKGLDINGGYMQVMNILYSLFYIKPEVIVIDKIEMSLHPFIRVPILNAVYFSARRNNSLLLITTDDISIFDKRHYDNKINIISIEKMERLLLNKIDKNLCTT